MIKFRTPSGNVPKGRRGMSLIISLAFIVILSFLIVAFFSSTMLEQSSSTSFPAQTYRQLLVDATIGHATALLAGNIPSPNYNPVAPALNSNLKNWWINPGRLTIQQGTASPIHTPLYSTPVPGQSAGEANLNALFTTWDGQQIHPIEPGGFPLNVAWVEVLRDPLRPRQSIRGQPNYNPVVGRYAFWIDSDTNRINFQTALGVDRHRFPLLGGNYDPSAGNFYPKGRYSEASTEWYVTGDMAPGLPTTIGFDGLAGAGDLDFETLYWNNMHQRTSTPDAASKYVPWLSKSSIKAFLSPDKSGEFWENNRFNITHHSTSPEFNVFGKPRMATQWFRGNLPQQELIQSFQLPFSADMLSMIGARNGDADRVTGFIQGASTLAWTKAQNRAYHTALGAYLQYPVPGLGQSFLDKWGQSASNPVDALAEVDQYSYNLQTAVATTFDRVSVTYDGTAGPVTFNGLFFTRLAGLRNLSDWAAATPAVNYMANSLFPGIYSGRGIGRHINAPTPVEIALRVTPRRQSADAPNVLHLEFALDVDFFLPEGFQNKSSSEDWAFDLPVYRASYMEFQINGQPVQARLRHTGSIDDIEANPPSTQYLFSANASEPYTVIKGGEILSARTSQTGEYAFTGDVLATPNVFFAHRLNLRSDKKENLYAFAPGDTVTITDIRVRIVTIFPRDGREIIMTIPAAGRPGGNVTGLTPAATIDEALVRLPDIEITSLIPGFPAEVQSAELSDPRLNHRAAAWQPSSGESLGAPNPSFLAQTDRSKLTAVSPASRPGLPRDNYYPQAFWYPFASSGFIFSLPTGQQRGLAWQTVNLSETQAEAGSMPPDYLLADLILPTAPDFTKQHASYGKININSRIYPEDFGQNIDRGRRVLASSVSNLRYDSTSSSGGTPINAEAFAQWMTNNEPAAGFPFAGRVLENPNLTLENSSEHARQLLRANVLGLFTTQSNTFTVHGLVETVDDNNGTLRSRSRHAFQAVIERQIFPGRDGIRGNGQTDSSGIWTKVAGAFLDRPASPGDTFDAVDGPDPVDLPLPATEFTDETASSTLLEDSFNPVLPYYIYEVLQVTPMDR